MDTTLTVGPRAAEVLTFWFGSLKPEDPAVVARWFAKDPAFDEEIRSRFGTLAEEAERGDCDAWGPKSVESSPLDALALVVLLDQFPRNLYRGSPRAFEQDPAALKVTLATLDLGLDRSLGYLQRYVLLMPTMHAEDRDAQLRGVSAFNALVEEVEGAGADEGALKLLRSALDYAQRHARIIERFGRFPHRNEPLGRASSPEELEFLKEPGSSF